jgi:hypothetical protein
MHMHEAFCPEIVPPRLIVGQQSDEAFLYRGVQLTPARAVTSSERLKLAALAMYTVNLPLPVAADNRTVVSLTYFAFTFLPEAPMTTAEPS